MPMGKGSDNLTLLVLILTGAGICALIPPTTPFVVGAGLVVLILWAMTR